MSETPFIFQLGDFIKNSAFCFINADLSFISNFKFPQTVAAIAYFEMVGGMIMTLISLARFIGMLPVVESVEII